MSAFTSPLAISIFNRPSLHNGNKESFPYPDSYERRLERQRVYNKTYYRQNKKAILKQKKQKHG